MAKPVPIPSLKKPSGGLPLDAMTSFITSSEPAAVAPPLPDASEPAPLALAPEAPEESAASTQGDLPPAPPRHARAKSGAGKGGRRLEPRKDGSLTRKVTIYLAPDLDRQLSLYAINNDVDRSEVIAEVLARFLKKTG
jgi:hypothetical protein